MSVTPPKKPIFKKEEVYGEMAATITTPVDDTEWTEFFTTVDGLVTFSTSGPNSVYILERAEKPAPTERGHAFMPGWGGSGILSAGNTFWVRANFGKAFFHHEEA